VYSTNYGYDSKSMLIRAYVYAAPGVKGQRSKAVKITYR
jgi:hypothetical protein